MTETISRAEIERIKREHILRNTLLDTTSVAKMLCCSVRTVYNLIDSGELEAVRLTSSNRMTRVTALAVEQYRLRMTVT